MLCYSLAEAEAVNEVFYSRFKLNFHSFLDLFCMGSAHQLINIGGISSVTTSYSLRKKCTYSELFWSVFSCIRTEYGEIRSIFLYSVRMRWNTDQNNSQYGHFLRSKWFKNLKLSFVFSVKRTREFKWYKVTCWNRLEEF